MPICTPYLESTVGRITVVTSATRPTGSDRYEGRYIYETDTDRTLVWDGSEWLAINYFTTTTSGARPTGADLYDGRRIYETDTQRELMYDGTGWVIMSEPAQSWTPTWGNLTSTGPTNTGWYYRSNGFLYFRARYLLGTAPTVGSITLTLPVAAASADEHDGYQVHILDAGTAHFHGSTNGSSTTVTVVAYLNAAATALVQAATSSTAPMTWAVNDCVDVRGFYTMTTRYS